MTKMAAFMNFFSKSYVTDWFKWEILVNRYPTPIYNMQVQ